MIARVVNKSTTLMAVLHNCMFTDPPLSGQLGHCPDKGRTSWIPQSATHYQERRYQARYSQTLSLQAA